MLSNFSKQNYEAIPSLDADSGASSQVPSSKRKIVIPLAIVLLTGMFFSGTSSGAEASLWRFLDVLFGKSEDAEPAFSWPPAVTKKGLGTLTSPNDIPTNTEEAAGLGWVKIEDEPCNEMLGEPWRIGGERSKDSCVTLYFTPQVGDTPGKLATIEADYYDSVEENLVGTYFKEAAEAKDGTYWSLSILLRKPTEQGVCDTSEPAPIQSERYIAAAPELVNNVFPIHREDALATFAEGACSPDMGFHMFQDVVSGNEFTYKASNLMPVTPMYNSQTGVLQAFYLTATDVLKRQWPYEKCGGFDLKTVECGFSQGVSNFWDVVISALWEENKAPFFFCNNFCEADCQFTEGKTFPGVPAGFMTMHFFFDSVGDNCEGFVDHHYVEQGAHFYCRDKTQDPDYMHCADPTCM
jgi:hypothetical protein